MSGYTKLFSSILMSSIWEETAETRIVWVTMLALADQHGHVDGTEKSIARVARVPLDACHVAITTFLAPDPDDRSHVDDGRRIRPEQGGWLIVNHAAYRDRMSLDDRRERDKLRKRAERDVSSGRPLVSANVRDVSHTEAEAEAHTEAYTEARKSTAPPVPLESPPDARSKRPIFSGQKLTVFEWMLDDCAKTLGNYLPQFDLHEWFFTLDAEALRVNLVIPKRDGGEWLQAQLVAEALRRGIPLTRAVVSTLGKSNTRLAAAMASIKASEGA